MKDCGRRDRPIDYRQQLLHFEKREEALVESAHEAEDAQLAGAIEAVLPHLADDVALNGVHCLARRAHQAVVEHTGHDRISDTLQRL